MFLNAFSSLTHGYDPSQILLQLGRTPSPQTASICLPSDFPDLHLPVSMSVETRVDFPYSSCSSASRSVSQCSLLTTLVVALLIVVDHGDGWPSPKKNVGLQSYIGSLPEVPLEAFSSAWCLVRSCSLETSSCGVRSALTASSPSEASSGFQWPWPDFCFDRESCLCLS